MSPGSPSAAPQQASALTGAAWVSVYRHPDEFPAALVEFFGEAEATSMQFSIDWYRNIVDTVFQGAGDVKFYVLELGTLPAAVLPMLCTRKRLGWHVQSLGNYYTALYSPLLRAGVTAQQIALLFKVVIKDHPGLGAVQLSPMAHPDPSFTLLQQGLKAAGLVAFEYFCFGNWYMRVDQAWAPYLKSRESRQRNTIQRMGKKFAAAGGRLEIIDYANIERGVKAYCDVYAVSWKQAEPYPDFMPGLIRLCAKRGWLRLGVAWMGDKPVAAQIWIVAHGKADIYKLAYDEAFKHFSPGTLLTVLLMQAAMDVDKVAEIDYLIGDDPYKETWMSTRRERWGVVAYNPRTVGGLLKFALELSGRCMKYLRAKWMRATSGLTPGVGVVPVGTVSPH